MADLQFSPTTDPALHPTWVVGTVITVYEDAAGTVEAAISLTDGGALVSGSTLTVTGTRGEVPVFYGRDPFASTLYLSAHGALAPIQSVTRPDPQAALAVPYLGTSAAAGTPGTVVKKIQVFDAAGVSLGYIAIYDAIT